MNIRLSYSRKKNTGPLNPESMQPSGIVILSFSMSPQLLGGKNKIRFLKNGVWGGGWIVDEEAVKEHRLMGFKKLYSTKLSMSPKYSLISEFSCCFLSDEERKWIGREVVEEAINNGL